MSIRFIKSLRAPDPRSGARVGTVLLGTKRLLLLPLRVLALLVAGLLRGPAAELVATAALRLAVRGRDLGDVGEALLLRLLLGRALRGEGLRGLLRRGGEALDLLEADLALHPALGLRVLPGAGADALAGGVDDLALHGERRAGGGHVDVLDLAGRGAQDERALLAARQEVLPVGRVDRDREVLLRAHVDDLHRDDGDPVAVDALHAALAELRGDLGAAGLAGLLRGLLRDGALLRRLAVRLPVLLGRGEVGGGRHVVRQGGEPDRPRVLLPLERVGDRPGDARRPHGGDGRAAHGGHDECRAGLRVRLHPQGGELGGVDEDVLPVVRLAGAVAQALVDVHESERHATVGLGGRDRGALRVREDDGGRDRREGLRLRLGGEEGLGRDGSGGRGLGLGRGELGARHGNLQGHNTPACALSRTSVRHRCASSKRLVKAIIALNDRFVNILLNRVW